MWARTRGGKRLLGEVTSQKPSKAEIGREGAAEIGAGVSCENVE